MTSKQSRNHGTKRFKKMFCSLLAGVFLASLSIQPAVAAPTYTEYGVYVSRPGSEAPAKYYHGAKYEPRIGAYLGAFAQGDAKTDDSNEAGYFNNSWPKFVGKGHALWLLYIPYQREEINHYHNYYRTIKAQGGGVQIAIEPSNGLDSVQDDAYLQKMVEQIRDLDMPVFLRFANEFNDSANGWHKDGPEKYKEKFRLFANKVHAMAPNAVMCWCPNDWPVETIDQYYPGDQYVDWVGVSSYPPYKANGAPTQGNTWIDRFRVIYDKYGARKPFYISEGAPMANSEENYAVNTSNEACYEIQRFYAGAAHRYPNLKAIVYWSSNQNMGGGKYRHYMLGDNPVTASCYAKVIKDDYYLTTIGQSSPVYYAPVTETALKAEKETLSAYANDVNHYIHHVAYYVNNEFVGQGDFPYFKADVDLSRWQGQKATLKADFYGNDGRLIKSLTYQAGIGTGSPATSVSGGNTTQPKPAVPTPVQADLKIMVNNVLLQSDVPPFIQQNRTYLPLRALGEALGAKVSWDNTTRTALVERHGKVLYFQIDENKYSSEGKDYPIDAPVRIKNNRTFVPVRACAEAFDIPINWDGATRTVSITTA